MTHHLLPLVLLTTAERPDYGRATISSGLFRANSHSLLHVNIFLHRSSLDFKKISKPHHTTPHHTRQDGARRREEWRQAQDGGGSGGREWRRWKAETG